MKTLRKQLSARVRALPPGLERRGSSGPVGRKSLHNMADQAGSCRVRQGRLKQTPHAVRLAILPLQIEISSLKGQVQRVLRSTPGSPVLVLLALGSISSDQFLGYS